MDESVNVISLMVRDHRQIEALVSQLEKSLDADFKSLSDAFEKLEWKLEKHLFVEERAIFTFYEPSDVSQGYKMLPQITKQHNHILNQLSVMRKDIQNGKTPKNLQDFKKYLFDHRDFEEKDVYPKLEDTLSSDQKQKMMQRINEIT
jgi:hemerythrin superfamily protein